MEDIELYLENAIASFDLDPPDSDYQRGYLAALHEVYADNCMNPASQRMYWQLRLGYMRSKKRAAPLTWMQNTENQRGYLAALAREELVSISADHDMPNAAPVVAVVAASSGRNIKRSG